MGTEIIIGCVAVIAVGVAIIMYALLRTPKTPAGFGARPSIGLGEMPQVDEEGEKEGTAALEEGTEE